MPNTSDVPAFLKNIPDTPEGQETISALTADAPAAPAAPVVEPTPGEPAAPIVEPDKDAPVDPDKPIEPDPNKPAEPNKDEKPEDLLDPLKDKKPEAPVVEPKKTEVKPADIKPTITDPDEILINASEKAMTRATEMTGKLTQMQEHLTKNRVIDISLPEIKNYANSDGTLDVEGYMMDTLKGFAMSLQQNLAGGPLAALMYGTLHTALLEDYGSKITESTQNKRSEALGNAIQTKFPIFKTNENLAKMFGKIAVANWKEHVAECKTKNEDPGKVNVEWLTAQAAEMLKNMNIDVNAVQVQDPIEKIHGGPNLIDTSKTTSAKDDDVEKDIDAMMNYGKKKSLF